MGWGETGGGRYQRVGGVRPAGGYQRVGWGETGGGVPKGGVG